MRRAAYMVVLHAQFQVLSVCRHCYFKLMDIIHRARPAPSGQTVITIFYNLKKEETLSNVVKCVELERNNQTYIAIPLVV